MRRAGAMLVLLTMLLPASTAGEGAPHIGLSTGIVARLDQSLSLSVSPADAELFVRWLGMESTLRWTFSASTLGLDLDLRVAPRAGAYVPACGVGLRYRSVEFYTSGLAGEIVPFAYHGIVGFVSVVPLRFDMGPLWGGASGRTGPELLVSALEIRVAPFHPEVIRPAMNWSFISLIEVTLLRVGIAL